MATRDEPAGRARRAGLRSAALILALGLPSAAVSLDFVPRADLSAIWSDNINISAEDPLSDTVLAAIPGISVFHYGQRAVLEADYEQQWFFYNEAAEGDASFGNGAAALGLEVIPGRFFIDSFAAKSQTYRDPLLAIPSGNVQITRNRADATSLETTPRLVVPVLGLMLDSAWTLGSIEFDEPDLLGADFVEGLTTLSTRQAGSGGLNARVTHVFTRFEYELPPIAERQELRLRLGYDFGAWGVFSEVGRESPFDNPFTADLEDRIVLFGVRYGGPRTTFEAFGGTRSFGDTFAIDFSRNIMRGVMQLSYSEQPFRAVQIFGRRTQTSIRGGPAPDPDIPPLLDVPVDINQPGAGSIFVRRLLQAGWSQSFNNGDVSLLLFQEERDDEIQADGTPQSQSIEGRGVDLRLNYFLGRRTTMRLDASYMNRRVESPGTSRDDRGVRFGVSAIRSIGESTSILVYYTYLERDGNISAAALFESNEIGITLSTRFGRSLERPEGVRDLGFRRR